MQPELVLYADNARAVCRERSWTAEVHPNDWVLNHYFEFMSKDAPSSRGGGRLCERCEVHDDGLLKSKILQDVRWRLYFHQADRDEKSKFLRKQHLASWRNAT